MPSICLALGRLNLRRQLGLGPFAPSAGGGVAPSGFGFRVDEDGSYRFDEDGNRRIGNVDEQSLLLMQAAAAKGMTFGTAIQSPAVQAIAGPSPEVPTLGDFMRLQSNFYAPGLFFNPDYTEPTLGNYTLTQAAAFVAMAKSHGKPFRIIFLDYPKRLKPEYKSAITNANWRSALSNRFAAIATVPDVQDAISIEVTNENFNTLNTNAGSYRDNVWNDAEANGGAKTLAHYRAPIVHKFQQAAIYFPGKPLVLTQDDIEQITDAPHVTKVANILTEFEALLTAGAPISSINIQHHLILRLGFNARAFRNFLSDIVSLGLDIEIGELDARTGYEVAFGGRLPSDFATTTDYDKAHSILMKRVLDVSLPFVKATSGRFSVWSSLSDIDHSWTPAISADNPPGERPLPWDVNYLPKAQYRALRNAILDTV